MSPPRTPKLATWRRCPAHADAPQRTGPGFTHLGTQAGSCTPTRPTGAPQAAWQPTITSVVANGNHYTLTGTQLNGLSAGATYGVGNEMDSNYPIVELAATDGSGKVYFARTSNWSSTGEATGSTPVTTDFSLNGAMPYGTYALTVIANGIASDPVSFTGGTVGPVADLVVTNSGPTTATEGDSFTYSLTVTNNGPYSTPGVVLTDVLDANLSYSSSTKSQGSSSHSGSVITFSFGSLGVGQSVTATVTAQAIEDGNLTNVATVASSIAEANPNDNTSTVTTAVAEAPIVVSSPINVSGKNQSNVKVATFTHANGVEPGSAFVATINWGDGSTSTGTITQSGSTYTVKGSHTYAQNGSHTVTTTVVEAGGGPGTSASANDMYVWNITAENRTHGNKQDARIDVVVRNDSNTDGLPGSSDAVVAGAKVTIELFTAAGALVGSDSGQTDSSGNFTSDWFKNLAAGTYVAEVLAVEKDGYRWNKSLDATGNDSDLNGNGLPDQQFSIPSSTAQSATALFATSSTPSNASNTKIGTVTVQAWSRQPVLQD